MVTGDIQDQDQEVLMNSTMSELISEIDLSSTKRRTPLSPNLFEYQFQYTCPTDLKDKAICDIQPQINRGRFDDWRLTTDEEFDRIKLDQRTDIIGDPIKLGRNTWSGENLIAVTDHDFTKKILISKLISSTKITIDPLTSVGSWVLFGDAENVEADYSNYVKLSSSVKFDISSAGGTTAGIQNSALSFDLTLYKTEGQAFIWVYIADSDDITNFILRLGSSSGAYYQMSVTTNNEGTAFVNGWNLLRFDFSSKTTVGTPVDASGTYCAVYMTKATGKISEVGYRFNDLTLGVGNYYNLYYYTEYGWQTVAGVYIQDSNIDTDYANVGQDELQLFKYKYAELAERHLRNTTQAEYNRKLYESKKKEYTNTHPSERLLMNNTYYNIG